MTLPTPDMSCAAGLLAAAAATVTGAVNQRLAAVDSLLSLMSSLAKAAKVLDVATHPDVAKKMSGDVSIRDLKGKWTAKRIPARPPNAPREHVFEPQEFHRVFSGAIPPVLR